MHESCLDLATRRSEFAGTDWRAIGATTDHNDQMPGPYARSLVRLGNNRNAFARVEARFPSRVHPGERVSFGLIVARPTALVSAICLGSEAGCPELRIRWSNWPPGRWLLGAGAGLCPVRGEVIALNDETFAVMLVAENTTGSALDVTPALHVAHGIENVGLDVGMHVGVVGITPSPIGSRAPCAKARSAAIAI